MEPRALTDLRNIGPTVAKRLNEIGIANEADLKRIGAVGAYRLLEKRFPDTTLPVCYYLYSLEGALLDMHWDDLPGELKQELEGQVRTPRRPRRKS